MQKSTSWLVFGLLLVMLSFGSIFALAQISAAEDTRIAFVSNRTGDEEIYLMTQNGEADPVSNLTQNPARDWFPEWSPDGSQLIFNSNRDGRDTLYIMNADGSGVRPLFPGESSNDYSATWSPDGSRIAFVSDRSGSGREVYVANADGSNVQLITDAEQGKLKGDVAWSPDSMELVYWELQNEGDIHIFRHNLETGIIQLITNAGPANGAPLWVGDTIFFDTNRDGLWYIYRMDSDGNFPDRISDTGVNSGRVTMSPDGSRVAFVTDRDEQASDEIYTMNPDGSSVRRLTDNAYSDHSPAWQPAVPENQIIVPTPIMAEDPTPEATEEAEDDPAALVGLGVSGINPRPLTQQQLLIDYGISAWHDAGWTGAGQRVGVIDTAFGGLLEFQAKTGEVLIPPDDNLSVYTVDNDYHGTQVLELIRLIAPNADLYACRYEATIDQLRECVDWMRLSGVQIINHSVGLPILPLDGNHEWAQLVDETFQNDILWVNSAGNFNQGYISDFFLDRDVNGYHEFVFGTGERSVTINATEDEPYTGAILLSWQDTQLPLVSPQTGLIERVDFDLEIVNRITGEVMYEGSRQQRVNADLALYEVVRIVNATQPFDIRVRNAGLPFEENVPLAIFVEFYPLPEDIRSNRGSVVAPADANSSLTIASVNADRELGVYSSRGLEITEYQKPDLAAPGEIIMSDGSLFVGTSAAAPVVSGISALLLEQDPSLTVDRLPVVLSNTWYVEAPNAAYGSGIVQLGAPPSAITEGGIIDTPPFTVFPRTADDFVDDGFVCATPLGGTRLEVGVPGYVNFDLGLRIRQQPDPESPELDVLDFGDQFEVIGGPECAAGSYWWLVELETGAEGYLAEGFDYYLIAPLSLQRAQLPLEYDTQCPNSLDTQLEIGGRGRLLQGGLFFFRSEGAQNQMDPLPAETEVSILGGPVCEGRSDNVLRWYVRVLNGPRAGFEGWVAEGDTDTRLMVPMED